MAKSIVVRATWDEEARVWVATSDDVPGLVAEAESQELLQQKLLVLIPELLEENNVRIDDEFAEVPLFVMSEQLTKVRTRSAA
mgnify:CR=1 FL=1|tara:strand:- start:182693 stop:182941 length:249 start_codon:yes stop_codon:yes gene_type:complete